MYLSALVTCALLANLSRVLARTGSNKDGIETDSTTSGNDDVNALCAPTNSTKQLDLNAPCNALAAILVECLYGGANGIAYINAASNSQSLPTFQEQDNATQRICACSSEFFDELTGCSACHRAHGGGDALAFLGAGNDANNGIANMSSSYCSAVTQPTADLRDELSAWLSGSAEPTSVQSAVATAVQTGDPLASNTAVSAYFAPTVTGSAAWRVADLTDSTGGTTVTSLALSGGEIVPTAGQTLTSSSVAPASTSSGGAVAVETGRTGKIVGAVGMVVVAVLL